MVVAIILILAGFGFVAVNRYQKRLKRVEMDNVAREIFVAAQNHLTASRAAGFWDGYVAQMEKDSSNQDFSSKLGKPVENGSTDKQYIADQENRNAGASSGASAKSSDNVLKILLPYAAVDETLLTDGKYYVHYDAATASVLDVYYTDKDTIPEYDVLNERAKNDVSYRTEHGVGWYGTAAIRDTEPQSELKAPVMAVRNAESLVVYIIDPNYKQFKSGVRLEIAQTGQDGKAVKESVVKDLTLNSEGNGLNMVKDSLASFVRVQHVKDTDNKPITLADGSTANDYMLYAVVLDSITRKRGHFSQLFPELTAGADITVTATVSGGNTSGDVKSSVTTNSLFEALNNGNALISNARHLENLSGDISALKAQVTTAEITDDLYWNSIRRTKEDGIHYAPYTGSAEAFIDAIRRAYWKYGYQSLDTENQGSDGSPAAVCVYSSDGEHWTDARKFAGIETTTLQKLSGNDHVLTGFDIVADFAGDSAPTGAGLFASVGQNGFEIDNLTVKNTRVYGAYTSGSSAAQLSAGTLVGYANGAVTLKNVSVVTDAIKDGEIYKAGTYSLTENKSGLSAADAASSQDATDYQISGVYSRDGIAGGLVGTMAGTLDIENSFVSVPVYAASAGSASGSGSIGNAGIAGGMVGKAAGGSITASFVGGYTETSAAQSSGNTSTGSAQTGSSAQSGSTASSAANDYTSKAINVAAPNGIAGGLVGAATGALKTAQTYTTASVSASVGGGFIGMVSGTLDLNQCYAAGRVFAKTSGKADSGLFAGKVGSAGSVTSSGSLRAADSSKSLEEVKNGVLAGVTASNGESSDVWTFPDNLIGGETDSKKSNPDTLQEISAEDLASAAGNDTFKADEQTVKQSVLSYAYSNVLSGKDYPYPTWTKTSDNTSLQTYAGYEPTGKTTAYQANASVFYGDWAVLSAEESSDVVLENDAVLYADVTVPDDIAKAGIDGAMTLIVVGESSRYAVCFVIKKENADDEPVHGTKLKLERLSYFGQRWYDTDSYQETTDTSAMIKEADDSSSGISVPGSGDASGSTDSSKGVTYRIYLDDITTARGHFCITCPVLVPGENIKVFAKAGDQKLTEEELKKYIADEDIPDTARANSLFGNKTEYDVDQQTGSAQIMNGRHLQNLDSDTSYAFIKYNTQGESKDIQINFDSAYLDTDVDWAVFKDQVAQIKETADENGKGPDIAVYSYNGTAGGTNKFKGIRNFDWNKLNQGITDFTGLGKSDNKVHSLNNLDIEGPNDSGSALFRDIRAKGMKIHDLNIENISSVSENNSSDSSRNNAAALFAYTQTLDGATVTVSNVNITGKISIESKNGAAGVLFGDTHIPTVVENTKVEGAISVKSGSNNNAGGFIGSVNGNGETSITGSSLHFVTADSANGQLITQSSVIGGQSAGGLIGISYSQKITVKDTTVTSDDEISASISASAGGSNAGGIIGYAGNLSAESTYAGGKDLEVTGSENVGGFVGTIRAGSIKSSAAAAYVAATGSGANAGGFIGNSNGAVISNSYAGGHTKDGQYQDSETGEGRYNVQSAGNAGGFAGNTNGGTITDCYSTASASGASYVGGFRGTGGGKITGSYCTGLVKATGQTTPGAFVGNNWKQYSETERSGNRYITRINAAQGLTDVGNNGQSHIATGVAYSALTQDDKSTASPFDDVLKQEDGYPFPAVSTIDNVAHYGDWPLLLPPTVLQTTMVNGEILYADIAPAAGSTSLPEKITVVIEGQSSQQYQQFVITLNSGRDGITGIERTGWADGKQSSNSEEIETGGLSQYARIVNGNLQLYLDDVTVEGGRFAELCPDLWAGESIKVAAFEGAQTLDSDSLSSYTETFQDVDAHSSLFADTTQAGSSASGGSTQSLTAHVAMNRHLQNLDASTGGTGTSTLIVTGAELDNDLDWSKFAAARTDIKGTTQSDVNFTGIVNSSLTSFDGNSHTISNLTIDNSTQTVGDGSDGAGYSGLFREIGTADTVSIQNLTLRNISSTGTVAGGLVGMHSGGTLTISGVSVLSDDNSSTAITASGSGSAGGLVGVSQSALSITGSVAAGKNLTVASGSSGSAGGLVGSFSQSQLTVQRSAAAVYVHGGVAAGGLIGQIAKDSNAQVTNSYAGGHTSGGFYASDAYNVIASADSGNAGGLIGQAAGTVKVTNAYSTASVSGNTAGGLIGVAGSSASAQSSYATGLINISTADHAGTFIGVNEHAYTVSSGNQYLRGVNPVTLTATGNSDQTAAETAGADVAEAVSYANMAKSGRSGTAHPYDTSTLRNSYPFRQAATINRIVHYGDWPTIGSMNNQYLVTFHYMDWTTNTDQTIRRIASVNTLTGVGSVTVPDLTTISGALEDHDELAGWYTAYDSTEQISDSVFSNLTSDLEVYAHVRTAVDFVQPDMNNPDNQDKEVHRTAYFDRNSENPTLTLPSHTSYLSLGYSFDGWYIETGSGSTGTSADAVALGTSGAHVAVTDTLKSQLKAAGYQAVAHYSKLKTYEVRVRFITKNSKQTNQQAIAASKDKGWTDDWVYTSQYGQSVSETDKQLPVEPNNYIAQTVCLADDTELSSGTSGSGTAASTVTASLTNENKYMSFTVTGPDADTAESTDNNIILYVLYQAQMAQYQVQHVFEDTVSGSSLTYYPDGAKIDSSDLTYQKGSERVYTETYVADTVGSMTKAKALTGDALPEGFSQDGWIQQQSIAADGSTMIRITYTRNSYSLSYDLAGGKTETTDANGKTVKQGYKTSEVHVYGEMVTLPGNTEVTRSGYELGTGAGDQWAVISKDEYDSRKAAASSSQGIIADSDSKYSGSFTMPAENCYAIANWKEDQYASVTVEIWRQTTTDAVDAAETDKTYNYETTVSIPKKMLQDNGCQVGDVLTYRKLKNLQGMEPNKIPTSDTPGYEHFTYNKISSPAIKADGSTVIKLYYNRNVITIQFYTWSRWYGYQLYKQLRGLYQADFSANGYSWPSNYTWIDAREGVLTFLTKFEAASDDEYSSRDNNLIVLREGESDSNDAKLENYLERSDDGRGEVVNGKVKSTSDILDSDYLSPETIKISGYRNYIVSNKYLGYSVAYAYSDRYFQLWPITSGESVSYYSSLKLYYTRNSYQITFNNVGTVSAGDLPSVHPDYQNVTQDDNGVYSISYLYKDEITWLPSVVTPPENSADIDDDYVFLGWYDSADEENAHKIMDGSGELTEEGKKYLGNNGTMPANNIQLFAHWAPPERTVIVDLDPKGTETPSALAGVKVHYNGQEYTADENGKCTITIKKGDTLSGLTIDADSLNNLKETRTFKEWRLKLESGSFPLNDTLQIYDDQTTVYALWAEDDTVTYSMVAIDPTAEEGKNVIATWTSEEIPRGTTVTLDISGLQNQIPEGYVLQEGGDTPGESKAITDDGMQFRFYYIPQTGGWTYTINQVILYQDVDDSSKQIEVYHTVLTRTTTDQQVVVNAEDLFKEQNPSQSDSSTRDLNYMYAQDGSGNTVSSHQVTLSKDGNMEATFYYTPDAELLAGMVAFTSQTLTYDGQAHQTAYSVSTDDLYTDDARQDVSAAAVSYETTYSYYDSSTGKRVSVDRDKMSDAHTYTATVEVRMTRDGTTITLARQSKACLTINPKTITFTSRDYSYTFPEGGTYQIPDGKQEGDTGYTQDGDFVGNDGDSVKVTFSNQGKALQIGTIYNVFTVTDPENSGNYRLVLNYGTLTTTWPLTVRHVLLYGPSADADGNAIEQSQAVLSTETMDAIGTAETSVSALDLTEKTDASDTTIHYYGLEVSEVSSKDNDWKVSYDSESTDYEITKKDRSKIKYSRYDADTHTYTVYYELPMLKASTTIGSDGNLSIQVPDDTDPEIKKLKAGAQILVDALNLETQAKESEDDTIFTRTVYSDELVTSDDGQTLSLNLVGEVTTYTDKNQNEKLDSDEVADSNKAASTEQNPNPAEIRQTLRSFSIESQQPSETESESESESGTATP